MLGLAGHVATAVDQVIAAVMRCPSNSLLLDQRQKREAVSSCPGWSRAGSAPVGAVGQQLLLEARPRHFNPPVLRKSAIKPY